MFPNLAFSSWASSSRWPELRSGRETTTGNRRRCYRSHRIETSVLPSSLALNFRENPRFLTAIRVKQNSFYLTGGWCVSTMRNLVGQWSKLEYGAFAVTVP